MQIVERIYNKKSGKGKRYLISLLLACLAPWLTAEVHDVAEMSLDDAIGRVCDVYAAADDLSISGESRIDAAVMVEFVRRHNPDFDAEIALSFIDVGRRYGIRGDVAFCQAIVETGWFRYGGGTAVTADCHNYCGLGVTRKGRKGARFASVSDGVTAHIQHLYAYCSTEALPKGERKLDPRFDMVSRGSARNWHELNGRWAATGRYSSAILNLYASLNEFANERKCRKVN